MKEWLNWINLGVAGLVLLLLFLAFIFYIQTSTPIESPQETFIKPKEPSSSFSQPTNSYEAIGNPAFELKSTAIGLQLPDLKKTLVYFGRNGRPDADPNSTVLNLGFSGSNSSNPLIPGKPAFIVYDKSHSPPRYEFSPQNAATSLWITVQPEGSNQARVDVGMKDENGELIETPSANRTFTIQEKPVVGSAAAWDVGKFRADGTLLARQRARWYGIDRFFERHGGEEYQHFLDKQRIEFGENENAYSVYVQVGDALSWDGDRWKEATPGEETLGKPLLVVKRVDDRLINLELWDPEGKSKVVLNLLKSNEPPPPPNVLQVFKYVGSRTRSQFVFEINKQRVMLSPHDWLLQTDKGWKKLATHDEIDAYVDGKTQGLLFVFDGVEKRDDRQILLGTLFNKSRSDIQKIEMVMETGASLSPATQNGSSATPTYPPHAVPTPQQIRTPSPSGEKPMELRPHARSDIREYKKKLR